MLLLLPLLNEYCRYSVSEHSLPGRVLFAAFKCRSLYIKTLVVLVETFVNWSMYHVICFQVAEHSCAVMETPCTLKRKLDCCSASAATVRKRLKLSQQRERRLKDQVQTFSEIINDLRKKHLVSEDASAMLEKCFSGVPV